MIIEFLYVDIVINIPAFRKFLVMLAVIKCNLGIYA